jgi:hypothetical protein
VTKLALAKLGRQVFRTKRPAGAVATSLEGHRQPRSGRAVRHPRSGQELGLSQAMQKYYR